MPSGSARRKIRPRGKESERSSSSKAPSPLRRGAHPSGDAEAHPAGGGGDPARTGSRESALQLLSEAGNSIDPGLAGQGSLRRRGRALLRRHPGACLLRETRRRRLPGNRCRCLRRPGDPAAARAMPTCRRPRCARRGPRPGDKGRSQGAGPPSVTHHAGPGARGGGGAGARARDPGLQPVGAPLARPRAEGAPRGPDPDPAPPPPTTRGDRPPRAPAGRPPPRSLRPPPGSLAPAPTALGPAAAPRSPWRRPHRAPPGPRTAAPASAGGSGGSGGSGSSRRRVAGRSGSSPRRAGQWTRAGGPHLPALGHAHPRSHWSAASAGRARGGASQWEAGVRREGAGPGGGFVAGADCASAPRGRGGTGGCVYAGGAGLRRADI